MLETIHDVGVVISMQETDGNVMDVKFEFLNIGDEDDAGYIAI